MDGELRTGTAEPTGIEEVHRNCRGEDITAPERHRHKDHRAAPS